MQLNRVISTNFTGNLPDDFRIEASASNEQQETEVEIAQSQIFHLIWVAVEAPLDCNHTLE